MSDPIEAATIGELLRKAAATFGDAEAVVGEGTRLTFRRARRPFAALARRLLGRGVAKGTHVGVSFGNNPDFLLSLLAVSRIGAVAVPISTFAPGRELLRLIRYGDLAAMLTTQAAWSASTRWIDSPPPSPVSRRPRARCSPCRPRRACVGSSSPSYDDDLPPWVTLPEDDGIAAPVDDALLDALEQDVVGTDVASDDPHLGHDVGPQGSAAHPRHRVLPRRATSPSACSTGRGTARTRARCSSGSAASR